MRKINSTFLALSLVGILFAPVIANAEAHPMIRKAQKQLQNAKTTLQHADKDFGGHRVAAIGHINEALAELDLALQADKK